MPHYFRNETAAHLALGAARYVKLVLWASISELKFELKEAHLPFFLANHLELLQRANRSQTVLHQMSLTDKQSLEGTKMLQRCAVHHVFIGGVDVVNTTASDTETRGSEAIPWMTYDVAMVNVVGFGPSQWSIDSCVKAMTAVRRAVKLTLEHPTCQVVFLGLSLKQAGMMVNELQRASFKHVTPLVICKHVAPDGE
jgi:hypothetical protein